MGFYQTNRALEAYIKDYATGIPGPGGGGATPFVNTYSLDLDGVDEYLTTDLAIPSAMLGNFSMSFWINADAYSGYTRKHPVAVSTVVTALDQTVHLRAWPNDFKVRIVGSLSGGGVGTTTLNDGSWHHVAYTYTYDAVTTYYTVNIYVDGNATPEVVAVMRTTGGYQTQGLYSIGVLTLWDEITIYAGTQFPGLIDEITGWDSALSTADIATLAGGPNNPTTALSVTPIAWYRCGDSTKALFFNSIWQIPNEIKVDNFSQYSFDFDGVDDSVNCGDLSAYDTGDFSFSIWLYKTTSNDIEYIISNSGSSSKAGIDIIIDKYENVNFIRNTRTGDTTTGYQGLGLTINNWHHIVGTYNDSTKTIMLYLDGVWQYTTTGAAGVNSASTDLHIGSYNASSNFFTGKIDETSIWDKELSAGEVTAIYNSGVPTDLSAESNLVGYWSMEGATLLSPGAPIPDSWSIPDDSTNTNGGTTSGMGADARINNAPDNTSQANSVNMEEADRVESVPS